ncbi:maltase 2-like [Planococcus citri]|uniref:maltase 2-like n=1 Tax=Planococcus citri TaxID=170843 RepID=UPI0031F94D11
MRLLKYIVLSIFSVCLKADFVISTDTLDWWQTSVIYQICPRSFKDSNSDGIGDLKGIEEKADYLKDLGIGTVWLTPIYKSPMADMGYDISDFKSIDPIFGTMADFESLRDKLHSLGMKLVLDFVPNHSSDEHEWFIKSVQRIDPYTDYYVWGDPKGWINETTPLPPNNWVGPFEQSLWSYHPIRKQFFLHQFARKQPDLNYRYDKLVEEMMNVIRFWLDKGVDGFRMDAVIHLVEDYRFLDEPIVTNLLFSGKPAYVAFDHKYTQCLPETYEMFHQFRELADSYKEKDGQTRVIMLEIGTMPTIENTMRFYGNKSYPISHIPFNFLLMDFLNDTSTAQDFHYYINQWMDNMPEGQWPNWMLGNHDRIRIADRYVPSSVDSMNTLLLLLPGTPVSYNGEEIGMDDVKLSWNQITDVYAQVVDPLMYMARSRDPERTPFQWDSSRHAGFSNTSGKTWLPVNPDYYRINVEAQKNDPKSHLNIYKNLIKLRSKNVFRLGDFKLYNVSEKILAFKRSLQNEIFIIMINLSNEEEVIDFKNTITDVPNTNFNIALVSQNSEFEVGNELNTRDKFRMIPKSCIVLEAIF